MSCEYNGKVMRCLQVIALLAVAALSGCAKYEYELVQPADLSRHIGETEQIIKRDPVRGGILKFGTEIVASKSWKTVRMDLRSQT